MAFVFDMDGVIVHSTPLHTRAWQHYLDQFGIAPEQVESRMHGLRNDDIVRSFFGEGLTDAAIHDHGAAKERLYRRMMAPELERWIVPGIREFLERHRAASTAIASNAEPQNIDFVLDGAGIRRYFRIVVNGHQAERPKPHPDIYLKAASLLSVKPENCIVFEDSAAGVQAARAAGGRVVGLTTTLGTIEDVELQIADFRDPRLEAWLSHQEPL